MQTTDLQILSKIFLKEIDFLQEVQLAVDKPKIYIENFASTLLERGVEEPTSALPWLALVDGLERRGLLQELDWKEDIEGFVDATILLTKNHVEIENIKAELLSLEFLDDDKEPEEIITDINDILQKFNLLLVMIDIDSDSYPLCIITLSKLEKAQKLATLLNYGSIKCYYNKLIKSEDKVQ